MKSSPRIIVVHKPESKPPAVETLETDAEFVPISNADEFRTELPTADALFVADFRSDFIRRFGPGQLRWIHTSSIGVDALTTADVVESGVTVTNTRGVFERPMAEWVLGALLMFAKDTRRTLELQAQSQWLHRETDCIAGRQVLLVGPGAVGRQTALLLRACGMTVEIVGRTERVDPELGQVHSIASLEALLPEAQDVVLALPLTEQTRHLLNHERLALLRPEARLVNVGRGALVDEGALVTALRERRLAGAALDVFECEPLPADHPFWGMEQVLVSPHMSADARGWIDGVLKCFATNLYRWIAGEPLFNVVSLTAPGTSGQPSHPAADSGASR